MQLSTQTIGFFHICHFVGIVTVRQYNLTLWCPLSVRVPGCQKLQLMA